MSTSTLTLKERSFLREKHVRQLIPVAHSTLWAWVRSGRFPSPIKLSDRITVWRSADIQKFIDQQGELL